MDIAEMRGKVTDVLETIQRDSGFASVAITGSTCPVGGLEGFDSKIWPVAISQIATAVGITIPLQQNIFLSSDGKQRLTIDEIAFSLCAVASGAA